MAISGTIWALKKNKKEKRKKKLSATRWINKTLSIQSDNLGEGKRLGKWGGLEWEKENSSLQKNASNECRRNDWIRISPFCNLQCKIHSGKNHQCMLKPASERLFRNRKLTWCQSITPQITWQYKGKMYP